MSETQIAANAVEMIKGDPSVELAANRTSLAFERTLMSADRTLMSSLRTALSLISFGFTIYQTFNQLAKKGLLPDADRTARNLGLALLVLGVVMLALGIAGHRRFGRELTRRRERLYGLGLLHTAYHYKATPTVAVAIALLIIGLAALASIAWRMFG